MSMITPENVFRCLLRMLSMFPFQLLMGAHVMGYPTFRRRRGFWLRAIGLALPLMVVFEACVQLFPDRSGAVKLWPDSLLFLLISAYVFCYQLFCYECTPREALYSTATAHAAQNIVFNVDWILLSLLGLEEGSPENFPIAMGLMLLFYALLYLVYRKWMADREGHTLPKGPVLINAVMILLLVDVYNSPIDLNGRAFQTFFTCIVADVIGILMQLSLIIQTSLSLENDIVRELLAAEQKKQRMTQENIELINHKCHDLKHQIHALKHMSDETERSAYVKQVEQAVLFYESAQKTGNETLDLILMDKLLYCQAHDISLTCVCDGSLLDGIDTLDLYALFGNALDNAIESVSREKKENRVISFRVGTFGGFLSIHFENYLGHEVKLVDGLPDTTKQNRGFHGFGVRSIRHIVEKYKGTLSIRTDQNLFRMDILIPMASE